MTVGGLASKLPKQFMELLRLIARRPILLVTNAAPLCICWYCFAINDDQYRRPAITFFTQGYKIRQAALRNPRVRKFADGCPRPVSLKDFRRWAKCVGRCRDAVRIARLVSALAV